MTLILPNGKGNWEKTSAEKKGYKLTKHGAFEGGCQFSTVMLRKENVSEILQQIAKTLWAMRQKMADLDWDDEQCGVFIGVQIRNKWQEIDGEWVELGGPEWQAMQLHKQATR